MIMLMGKEKIVTKEALRVVRERIREELVESRVDDERERERKEEDDGESEEVTRVSVDDSLRFGEDSPEVKRWSSSAVFRRRHGGF